MSALLTVLFSLSADVLSEEAILKWYTEAHLAKGKSVFLEQMKKFVEWLKNAEEGKDGEITCTSWVLCFEELCSELMAYAQNLKGH